MQLRDIYGRVKQLTEITDTQDGIWLNQGMYGTTGLSLDAVHSMKVAVDKRLAQRKGIDASAEIAEADRSLQANLQYNNHVTLDKVTSIMDAAVADVLQEVATEYTKGSNGVQARNR